MTEQAAADAIARLRSLVWEANGLIGKLCDYGIIARVNRYGIPSGMVPLEPPADAIELILVIANRP